MLSAKMHVPFQTEEWPLDLNLTREVRHLELSGTVLSVVSLRLELVHVSEPSVLSG